MICRKISPEFTLSEYFFAGISRRTKITINIRFATLEITVADATPCTPRWKRNRNTAFNIKFRILPVTVAIRGCFVYPNARRYPASMGIIAFSMLPPPTIRRYCTAGSFNAGAIPTTYRIPSEQKNKKTDIITPRIPLNHNPRVFA